MLSHRRRKTAYPVMAFSARRRNKPVYQSWLPGFKEMTWQKV